MSLLIRLYVSITSEAKINHILECAKKSKEGGGTIIIYLTIITIKKETKFI